MEALSVSEFLFFGFVIILSYAIRGSAGFGGVTVPLLACAAALPLMVLGAFLGSRIHANLEQLKFRRLVAVILLASGIPLLLH
jgi:uncharacterized membrane protein YfcA